MEIDLLKIITDAKKIYCRNGNKCIMGMCSAIRLSIIQHTVIVNNSFYVYRIENHIKKTVHKPPKHYYPLKARHIEPYWDGYWWKLCDFKSRLKRFDEYIEYFKKPENRYLVV